VKTIYRKTGTAAQRPCSSPCFPVLKKYLRNGIAFFRISGYDKQRSGGKWYKVVQKGR
jgi:hypothetical protein